MYFRLNLSIMLCNSLSRNLLSCGLLNDNGMLFNIFIGKIEIYIWKRGGRVLTDISLILATVGDNYRRTLGPQCLTRVCTVTGCSLEYNENV